MGNPSATRIGQGAAQVFDTRDVQASYSGLVKANMDMYKRDMEAAQKLIEDFDPAKQGLRTADLKKYQDMYGELKDLYINNKSLYKNPASNIEAYKKAEEIKRNMKALASKSKEYYQFQGDFAKAHLSDPDKFEPGVSGKILASKDKSIDEIEKENGGRMYSQQDVMYTPKTLDEAKYVKDMHGIMDATGDFSDLTDVQKDGMGMQTVTNKRSYGRKALDAAFENLPFTNRVAYQNYKHLFDNSKPEDLQEVQAQLDQRLGDNTFEVKDPTSLAKAEFYINYGVVKGSPKRESDKQWEENKKKAAEDRAFGRQQALQNRSFAHSEKLKTIGKTDGQVEDDQLMIDSRKIADELKAGGLTPESNKMLAKLSTAVKVRKIDPRVYKDKTFRNNLKVWADNKMFQGDDIDVEDPNVVDKLKSSGFLLFERSEGSKKVYSIVDPGDPNADVKIYNLFRTNKENPKKGVSKSITEE